MEGGEREAIVFILALSAGMGEESRKKLTPEDMVVDQTDPLPKIYVN
jgi:hypothetical protein